MEVNLLKLNRSHLETVRSWRNSPEVASYMYSSDYISKEEHQKWFARIAESPADLYWMIEFSDRLVGVAYLNKINKAHRTAEWGFYVGDPGGRGVGLGSKVEFSIIEMVFISMGMNKLSCEVFESNDRVIAMHQRFGFRREGFFREHVQKDGVMHNVVRLALLNSEWLQVRDFHKGRIHA